MPHPDPGRLPSRGVVHRTCNPGHAQDAAGGRQLAGHPLVGVLAEFKRRYGDVWLDLSGADVVEGRRFVDALLDSTPNRLGGEFRAALFRRTEGHPLFTTELLRVMRARGDLIRVRSQAHGGGEVWVEGRPLDWETLPPRVEGVIAARVDRLDKELRELLTIASVKADEWEVIRQLSGPLEDQYRLITWQGARHLGGLHLSLHRFRHNLFRKYLYKSMNQVERAYLHEDVGDALEGLYADHPQELAAAAPQLARHFQEAGVTDKAIHFLRQAGERAVQMSAHQEAIAYLSQAIRYLDALSESPQRSRTELALQASLSVPFLSTKGWAAPEVGRALERGQELCEKLGEPRLLFPILFLKNARAGVTGDFLTALEIGEQMLALAERTGAAEPRTVAHAALAFALVAGGAFAPGLIHAERVNDLYDVSRDKALAYQYGNDPGVLGLAYASWALWFLGYPNQARSRSHKALAFAERLSYPFSIASAQYMAAFIRLHCGDWQRAQELAKACVHLTSEHGFPIVLAVAMSVHGRALIGQRRPQDGVAKLRRALADLESAHSLDARPMLLSWLADAYGKTGKSGKALAILAEALALTENTGDRRYEAEINRLRGELLRGQGADADAEASFQKSVAVARAQSAKSFELRATMSLARLWRSQGKVEAACEMLAEVYAWFTEGFDTADLQDARALLDELGGGSIQSRTT
jgi:tetratricopeptide (TPR) repeat protein